LTLYSFTGDTLFRDKAQYVADKLLPAFQTPTGIPLALVNIKSGVSYIIDFFLILLTYIKHVVFILDE